MSNPAPKSPRPLVLPRRVAAAIVAAAHRQAPLEACGLLVGRAAAGAVEVIRTAAARNLATRPAERFTLAPADFLAAERGARADGFEVVGFWHSHPATGPEPSAVDRDAAWEGYSYLIVSLAQPRRPRLACWRLAGDGMVAQEIVAPAVPARGTGR